MALAAYVLYGFNTLVPVAVAPLVAGIIGGYLGLRDWRWTSLVVAAGQTAGFWAANWSFTLERGETSLAAAPAYVHADLIAGSVYGSLVRTILEARSVDSVAAVAMWLAGLAIAAGVAALLERSGLPDSTSKTVSQAPFFAALMLVGAAFAVTLYGAGGGYRQSVGVEPQQGQYAVDYAIYAEVNWLLDRGVPYYQALVQAAAGDARLIEEGSVKDGTFVAWATSPSMVRQPWSFRFLQAVSPAGPAGVFDVSAVCAALALLGFSAAIGTRSRAAGLAVATALYPFLVMAAGWHDIMLPDWWASLAVVGSAAAMLARPPAMRYAAIALALAAALFRETAIVWLVVLMGVLVWDWSRRRERRQLAALATGVFATVAFALSYGTHIRRAQAIIDPGQVRTLVDVLKSQAAGPIEVRFLAPTSYLLFPYGQFAVPGFVLIALGAAAYLTWGMRRRDVEVLAVGLYVVAWMVYLLVIGTFSAYWGLMFSGLGLAGIGYWVALGDPNAEGRRSW